MSNHVSRELRAKAGAPGEEMEICDDHNLSIADGVVTLLGEGDPSFFERAEEVEEFKVCTASRSVMTCTPLLTFRKAVWRICLCSGCLHECLPSASQTAPHFAAMTVHSRNAIERFTNPSSSERAEKLFGHQPSVLVSAHT